MGVALCNAADHVPPDDASDAKALLGLCAQAHQNALQVYTKADWQEVWAGVENSLGVALDGEGRRSAPDQAVALYEQAAQAYRAALEFYTKAGRPLNWARSQNNLGLVSWRESQLATGDKATAMLEQSALALRNALEVWNQTATPWDWANAQFNLGLDLWLESQRVPEEKATALLNESMQATQNALLIYTKADHSQEWATTQGDLGLIHAAQGNYSAALTDVEAEEEVYPKDVVVTLRLAEANLFTDHFEACLKQAGAVTDAQIPGTYVAYMVVRESIKLACQLGVGDKGSALQTEKSLSTKTSLVVAGWNSFGPRRYLSTSPTFAKGRASWVALFTALQTGDGPAMTAALHQLEPLMQN
jgi:hypothetical protein